MQDSIYQKLSFNLVDYKWVTMKNIWNGAKNKKIQKLIEKVNTCKQATYKSAGTSLLGHSWKVFSKSYYESVKINDNG